MQRMSSAAAAHSSKRPEPASVGQMLKEATMTKAPHRTCRSKARQPARSSVHRTQMLRASEHRQPHTRGRTPWRLPMLLTQPSPPIADTCTTENTMLYWADCFGRFHRESLHYVPYEVKTLDCPIVSTDNVPILREGQPVLMRCVREVARHELNGQVEWLLISWFVGIPGIAFSLCSSLADAQARFNAPADPVQVPRSLFR